MTRPHVICGRLVGLILLASGVASAQPVGQKVEAFDADPKWESFENRRVPNPAPITEQNFGYSETTHAKSGKGEIGGRVQRSTTPAYYAMEIPTKTFNDKLKASGKFSVTHAGSGSNLLFGWFNDKSRGWRTPNSLVIRLDGNGGNYWVFFEYGTRHWLTGGGETFEGERYQTTPSKPYAADGTVHEWSFEYDPAGNKGVGIITFTLDGQAFPIDVLPEHRADGVEFNRFGILNAMTTGGHFEAWFDDVVVDGKTFDFSQDPKWDAKGNRVKFEDRVRRPMHDFGYSDTNHAGGSGKGEVGGVIWRDEAPAYHAAKTDKLSLNDKLFASGKLAFNGAGSDSGVFFGWFDSQSKRKQDKPQHESPPKNLLAIALEGPSRIGHYFRPAYYDSTGKGEYTAGDVIIRPDGKVHDWSMAYDPDGAGGKGQITVKFDKEVRTFDLRPDVKKAGATFDRFGLFNMQSGGHYVFVYLDDLTYTTSQTK